MQEPENKVPLRLCDIFYIAKKKQMKIVDDATNDFICAYNAHAVRYNQPTISRDSDLCKGDTTHLSLDQWREHLSQLNISEVSRVATNQFGGSETEWALSERGISIKIRFRSFISIEWIIVSIHNPSTSIGDLIYQLSCKVVGESHDYVLAFIEDLVKIDYIFDWSDAVVNQPLVFHDVSKSPHTPPPSIGWTFPITNKGTLNRYGGTHHPSRGINNSKNDWSNKLPGRLRR